MTNLLDAAENPLVQRLGWTLLHFIWQGALLGACIGLALILLRRSSSATRYNLLLAGFALLAMTPVITFFIVAPAAPIVAEPATSIEPVSDSRVLPPTLIEDPDAFSAVEPHGLSQQLPLLPQDDPLAIGHIGNPTTVEAAISGPTQNSEQTFARRVAPILPYVVAGWLLGVVLISLRLIGAWRRVQRLLKRDVREFETRWTEVGRRLLSIMEIRRTVRFLESNRAAVPVVIGWLKPVVLVPTCVMTYLTFEEAEALLAHELAHIRRCDEIVNLLQTVVETLLFFHPVVWIVSARLRQEREHCCDELAAEVVGDRLIYSRALVAVAELATEPPHRLAVASTGGSLQQRIERLLDGAPPQRMKARWPVVVAFSVVTLLSGAILSCSPDGGGVDSQAPTATVDEADDARDEPAGSVDNPTQSDADQGTAIDDESRAGTERVAGRVVDPSGTPVGAASVYLLGETQQLTVFDVQGELRPRLEGDGPERRTTTNAEGRFTLPHDEEWNRIAVVADQCPLWIVERSEVEALDDIQVQLPETGEISVIVDLPDEEETVELLIGLQSFDGRVWRRDSLVKNYYEVDNPAETVISGLPPATYSVERVDVIDFGTHGLMLGCERQILPVSAEETAEASFSRQFGVRVSGIVQGLDRDDFGHASLASQYWGPEEAPLPDGRRSRMMTNFDGIKLERDGEFTTQPMPPGEYAFYVSAFLDGRTGGSPDLRGSVIVNVPVAGEVNGVTIEVSPEGRIVHPQLPDDPTGVAAAVEAFDRELVNSQDQTPQQLVAGIERAMQKFLWVDYSGEYEEVRDANAFREGEEPLDFTGAGQFTYRSDGRRWFAEEHGFTHTIGSTDVRSTRALSGFDGTVHYSREGDIVTLGEDTLAVERRAPHKVFWEIGKNWSWLKSALEDPSATVTDYPVINGHRCVRIHSEKNWPGGEIQFQYEIVISPEQSFLPLNCVIQRNGEPETTWAIEDLAQTADGLWYPRTIITEHANPFPTKSMRLTISSLELRNDFRDADFEYPVPGGVDVVDYPDSRVYFNDPWWPELKALLRDRFDRPTPWLTPTDDMSSYSDGTIHGREAPAIEASEWINGDPGGWDRPDRGLTVLFFFGGRAISPTPKWLAAINALHQKYRDGGLELMGVVSSSAAEGARQTAREFGLTFPIAVAAPSENSGSYGRPHDAFGLQHYAGVFVIDQEGIVHAVNSPQLQGTAQLQLEPLVQNLMGLPADEFVRPDNHLTRPQWDIVVEEWRRLRRSSTADAALSGQVAVPANIDARRIDLTLTPLLRLVSGHTPYGHTQQVDDTDSVTVSCDANGQYEFSGLAKGTYRLIVLGPGVERQERFVAVAEEDSDVIVNLTVDEAGQERAL